MLGSTRVPRVGVGVPPSHSIPIFRRDAENHTRAGCTPRNQAKSIHRFDAFALLLSLAVRQSRLHSRVGAARRSRGE